MKKIALISLAAFLIAFTGCAKEDSTQTDNPVSAPKTTTAKAVTTTTKPAEIVACEMTNFNYKFYSLVGQLGRNEIWLNTIVEYTNTGNVPLYFYNGYFDLEDSEGYEVVSHNKHLYNSYQNISSRVVGVGEKVYCNVYTRVSDMTEIPSVDYVLNTKPEFEKAEKEVTALAILDNSIAKTDTGISVNGEVENNSSEEIDKFDMLIRTVLFDKANKPLFIVNSKIEKNSLSANEKSRFASVSDSLSTGGVTSYLDVADFVNFDEIASYKTFSQTYYSQNNY
jgi:hypothetical protein